MKQKRYGRRLLTMLFMLCMLFTSYIFSSAQALDETVLDIGQGNITFSSNAVSGWTSGGSQVTEVNSDGYMIVGTTSQNRIIVESGAAVSFTLQNVTMNLQSMAVPAIYVEPGASLTLCISEENTLVGGSGFAAISVAPAYDGAWNYLEGDSAALILTGDGTLYATGGNGSGTAYGGGAGIGGDGQNKGDGADFGSIVISNGFTGRLVATGGAGGADSGYGGGAGIGSGGMNGANYYWGNVCGTISIQNGSIVASSNGSGAGIGGGGVHGGDVVASQIEVSISGGTVTTTGGSLGAGIGGGTSCDGGFISISGGIVTAKAGANEGSMGAAGIGGGDNAAPSSVIITGGKVTAVASGGAAGIGGGTNTPYSYVFDYDNDMYGHVGNKGIIAISGQNTTVYAYGGTGTGSSGNFGGAGIGSGYPTANNQRSVAFDISITNRAKVYAHGGYHAQAVGYGFRPNTSNPANYYTGYGITLRLDDTITLWALNADFHQPALVAATQYDDSPVSYSSYKSYLVRYTDENIAVAMASTAVAAGQLDASLSDSVTVDWSFSNSVLALTLNGNNYNFTTDTTAITGNWATLYMPLNEITVSYQWTSIENPNDVAPPETDTIEEGTAYTAKTQAATLEDYIFDGWYTDENCTIQYVNGTVLNEATILYGKWSKPALQTGNLTVTKTVSGMGASIETAFAFTVTLGDTTINGTYGDLTFTNGVAAFTLKHGESKTATGLPDSINYAVAESNHGGYTVTATGATGSIAANATARASFNNHRYESGAVDPGQPIVIPQTGDNTNMMLCFVLLFGSAAGAFGTVLYPKRKRAQ